MHEPTLARRVLSGEAGWWAAPFRSGLSGAEFLYTYAIQIRNARYDSGKHTEKVATPVISVGNITAGGTGKTPFVIDLVQRLEKQKYAPAVVARGYGAHADQPNDEELLMRKYCPGIAYVADADRVRGARRAVTKMGADVVLLDDGFQHRRLHRDLDILLIDALCPFGYGHVLPRGLLREPLTSLLRAHLIVITRSDQVSANEIARIESQIRLYNPTAPILKSRTIVAGTELLDGIPVSDCSDRDVLAFAAIGRPQAFLGTLKTLGVNVVATRWWPDHHAYRSAEIAKLMKAKGTLFELAITTEKDAVKLTQLGDIDAAAIAVVKIAREMLGDGNLVLDRMLGGVLNAKTLVPT